MRYDTDLLARACESHYSDNPDLPVAFYGGVFSNFVGWRKPMAITAPQPWGEHSGRYRTCEHFFQASKAWVREDHDLIASQHSPGEAKAKGRSRRSYFYPDRPFLRDDWDRRYAFEYMVRGLLAKFEGPDALPLERTSGRLLVEDSPFDYVWGVRDQAGGFTGRNLLGVALMLVRRHLVYRPSTAELVDYGVALVDERRCEPEYQRNDRNAVLYAVAQLF